MTPDVTDTHRLRRQSRGIIGVALAFFFLLVTDWQPWNLFARAGFSTDFYDTQARSFWHGHIAVDPGVALFEGFVVNGKTYLYYGPFLALTRLPFTLGTNLFDRRLTRLSMLIAFGVTLTWSRRLVERTLLRVRSTAAARAGSGRRRMLLFLSAVGFSPLLFGSGWPSVYHETELWACAFAVVSIVTIIDLVNEPSQRRMVYAVAAVAATVLTRVTVGLGVGGALLIACVVLQRHEVRRWWAGVVGVGVAVGIHVGLNFFKFGSAFGLPGGKQVLSQMNPKRAAWFAGNHDSFFSVRFLTTTIAQYFRPDGVRFERLFPFIRFPPLAQEHGSYPIEFNAVSSSLSTTAMLLLIFAIVGISWMVRRRQWLLLSWTASMFTGGLAVFAIGSIANRYLIDVLSPLIVAGAVGVWVVPSWSARRAVRAAAATLAILATVWGLTANVALAVWTTSIEQPGFTRLRYSLDDALFGPPAPALLGAIPAQMPREGVVALDADCGGVYIARESRWVALERRQGGRRYSGMATVPTPGASLVVARTATWQMAIVNGLGVAPAVEVTFGDGAITTTALSASAGAHVRVQIVDDAISHENYANVGDAYVFFPRGDSPGALQTPGLMRDSSPGDSLCLALSKQISS